MNEKELASCPFCGHRNAGVFQHVGDDGPEELYRGSCWNCAAATDWHRSPDEAITAWNTRYDAGRSQWVAIRSVDDLPKEPCIIWQQNKSGDIWRVEFHPDIPRHITSTIEAVAWHPDTCPAPYRTPEDKQ